MKKNNYFGLFYETNLMKKTYLPNWVYLAAFVFGVILAVVVVFTNKYQDQLQPENCSGYYKNTLPGPQSFYLKTASGIRTFTFG